MYLAAANTNFIVTGLTLPGLKLTIYHTPYLGSNSQSITLPTWAQTHNLPHSLPGLKLTIYHTPYLGSNSQSTTFPTWAQTHNLPHCLRPF